MDDLSAVLASIGMTVEPDEGVILTDAVMITKEVDMNTGAIAVKAYWSESLDKDWITRQGLYDHGFDLVSPEFEDAG